MKSVYVVGLFAILLSVAVLAQSNPVPFISQPLVPTSVAPGGPGFTLKVNGAGFVASSVVNWNGATLPTTVVSGTNLTVKVPAAKIRKAGTASITVVNPGAQPSNIVFFSVGGTAPVLTFNETQIPTQYSGYPVLADFNNDHIQDILIRPWLGGVWVLRGKGDGTFKPGLFTSCGVTQDYGLIVTVADFNGDGKLDVAAGYQNLDNTNYVAICLGNGDGKFTPLTPFPVSQGPQFLLAGDFNGDGILDLAIDGSKYTFDYTFASVELWLGHGDGTFEFASSTSIEGGGTSNASKSAALGDFNGDGWLDIVVAATDENSLGVLLGNGDGTLQPVAFYPVNRYPEFVTVADFNGDKKLDLAVTNLVDDNFSVLLGNGDGTFQSKVDYTTAPGPQQIVAVDLDRDGKLDIAVATASECDPDCGNGAISVYPGNGDGTFQSRIDYGTNRFSTLAVADFNGDGRLDLFSTFSVFLQGSQQPNVVLTPTSLTFADQNLGTPSPAQTVTLTNTGTGQLSISGFSFAGANPGDFTQTNNCGTGVPGGGSCTIQVVFAPTATGARAAILQVSDNAAGSPQTVSVAGNGVAPAASLSTSSLTFPTTLLGVTSASQTVTLTNSGTGQLSITSIVPQGDFLEQNNCGSGLTPGQSCTITVQFKPQHKDTRTGAVVITDNAPDNPQSVSLTGVGTVVQLSAIGINFGNQKVGTSHTSAIKLTNVRDQPLTIFGITIDGANPGDFSQVNTCGASVPAHGHCQIRVTFTPTALGSRSGTLEFSDDGGGSPQSVTLSGNGT